MNIYCKLKLFSACWFETENVSICDALLFILPVTREGNVRAIFTSLQSLTTLIIMKRAPELSLPDNKQRDMQR